VEPILTLPYSEWLVAEHLMRTLPSRAGYSVYAPLSRQERGVDLLLTRRIDGVSRVAALQIKFSRAYEQKLQSPFKFGTLFKRFEVGKAADFFVLASLYPNITGRGGGRKASWWLPLMLMFEREEMATFMDLLQTRSGKRERMFYFGFDSPREVVLTRGRSEDRDFTCHTLENRLALIRKFLGAA